MRRLLMAASPDAMKNRGHVVSNPVRSTRYMMSGFVTLIIWLAIACGGEDSSPSPVSQEIDPTAGLASRFEATSPMNLPRKGHAAVRLSDGRVLVVGGEDDEGGLASSEIYDPGSSTWSLTGDMIEPRSFARAVTLDDGRVLVVGGGPGDRSVVHSTAEIYDPATGKWSTTGSMMLPRAVFSLHKLNDGRVMAVGGFIGQASGSTDRDARITDRVEMFDPGSETWTEIASLPVELQHQEGALLPDGRVLIAGGWLYQGAAVPSNRVYVYDPKSDQWSAAEPLGESRTWHSVTRLANGELLIAGGFGNLDTAATYDADSGQWTDTTNMVSGHQFQSVVPLLTRDALLTGGPNNDFVPQALAERYDSEERTWSALPNLSIPRDEHSSTLLENGEVLIVGGLTIPEGEETTTNTAELFVP